MQSTDPPLVAPLGSVINSLFDSSLAELATLRQHKPPALTPRALLTNAPPSLQQRGTTPQSNYGFNPNGTTGSSRVDGTVADSATLDGTTDPTMPSVVSTANSTTKKKPERGGSGKAKTGKADDASSAPLTLTTQPPPEGAGEDLEGGLMIGCVDPWAQTAAAIQSEEATFLAASEPSLRWAQKRYEFFCDPNRKFLVEDVLGEWVQHEAPEPQSYVIDAVALAQEHTKHLEELYGYRAPRGLHEVGKTSPRQYDRSAMLQDIAEHHGAGGATAAPEFVCADTVLKSTQTTKLLAPAPPLKGTSAASQSRKATKLSASAGASDTLVAKSESLSKTKNAAALERPQLKCDVESVQLSAEVGRSHEQVLTYWNMSTYSLRIKPLASTWSWFSVECVDPKHDPDVPLPPGSTIQLRVAYTPQVALADPTTETKVSLGFTRELNQARSNDASHLAVQWSFVEVPVTCTTILPMPRLVQRGGATMMMIADDNDNDNDGGSSSRRNSNQNKTRSSNNNSVPIQKYVFESMFVHTTTKLTHTLRNEGAPGLFRIRLGEVQLIGASALDVVTPKGKPEALKHAILCEVQEVLLMNGETAQLPFCFTPMEDALHCVHVEISAVAVTGEVQQRNGDTAAASAEGVDDAAPVVATLRIALEGRGVVPRVAIESCGDVVMVPRNAAMDWDGMGQNSVLAPSDARLPTLALRVSNQADGTEPLSCPTVMIPDAAAGHTSKLVVALRNDSILGVMYRCVCEAGVQHDPAQQQQQQIQQQSPTMDLSPSVGILPPMSRVEVVVSLTPRTDTTGITGLFRFFIGGMPAMPSISPSDATSLLWLSRDRLVPTLTTSSAAAAPVAVNSFDPFGLFARNDGITTGSADIATTTMLDASGDVHWATPSTSDLPADEVFVSGVRIVADPQPLRVSLNPSRMISSVECLTGHENCRVFTIQNHSPREVSYCIDPSAEAFSNMLHGGTATSPAAGGGGALDLNASTTGGQYLRWVKQMKELYGSSWAPSTQKVREGCRLTFVPQQGVVPGKGTLEVTCYFLFDRVGRHALDIPVFIPELGKQLSPTLTVVADAAGPTAHLSTALLDFGIIAVGDEAEARLTVSNHHPVKIDFSMNDPASCTPARFVFLPPHASLAPGKSIDVTVYRQGLASDADPTHSTSQSFIEVVVKDGGTSAVEVRATIERPAVSVSPASLSFGEMDAGIPRESEVYLTNLSSVDIPFRVEVVHKPESMSILYPESGVLFGGQRQTALKLKAQFDGLEPVAALLQIVSARLTKPVLFEVSCSKVKQVAVSLNVRVLRGEHDPPAPQRSTSVDRFIDELLRNLLTMVLDDADTHPLTPFCQPLVIPYAVVPDNAPFCAIQSILDIRNNSGCVTHVAASGVHLTPIPTPIRYSTSNRVEEPSAALIAASNGTGKNTPSLGGTTNSRRGSMRHLTNSLTAGQQQQQKEAAVKKLTADKSSFACKAIDGRATIEDAEEKLKRMAQTVLLDGRGCAMLLRDALAPLPAFTTHTVTSTIIANLPGTYREKIHIECEGLPPVQLPIDVTVRAKPVLLDPTTSGLANDNGQLRLTLPSVVAGMSRAKRRLRLINRFPRDVDVAVQLSDVTNTITAVVQSQSMDVTVQQASSEQTEGPSAIATVSPRTCFIPALGHVEVTVEFAPTSEMHGSWQANLSVTATLARTDYNDLFMIDEFYLARQEQYPTERALFSTASPSSGAEDPTIIKADPSVASGRSISMLNVLYPVHSRPGVIQDSKFVMVPSDIQAAIDTQRQQQNNSLLAVQRSGVHAGDGADDVHRDNNNNNDSSDDDDDGGRGGNASAVFLPTSPSSAKRTQQSTTTKGKSASKSKSAATIPSNGGALSMDQILEQDDERQELKEYLSRRYYEVAQDMNALLIPLRVFVLGVIMPAQLVTDPPEVLRFPMCAIGESATRCIRLTNPTRTPLDFTVKVLRGPYKIVRMNFIGADAPEDILEEDDEEGVNARTQKRLVAIAAAGGVHKLAATQTHHGANSVSPAATKAVTMLAMSTLGGTRRQDPNSDPSNTLFHLRPRDAIDLTVEMNHSMAATLSAPTRQGEVVLPTHRHEGALQVSFTGTKFTQVVPCMATVHVPTVVCEPDAIWFRPLVIVHDGRPQAAYKRPLALLNHSTRDATFRIEHVPKPAPIRSDGTAVRIASAGSSHVINRLTKVKAVMHVSPMEQHAQLVDDPKKFQLSAMSGVVPAASSGGQPGRLVIYVDFEESANATYESSYRVVVDSGVGADFSLRGDSRQTEVGF